MEVFTFEDWEIPLKDLWRTAVLLEEVKEGVREKGRIRLSNGFDLAFWRGKTAVFWEYVNFSLGIRLTNSEAPLYFPEAEALVRLMLSKLKNFDFTETTGNLLLRKEGERFLVTPLGNPEWEDHSNPYRRLVLSSALRKRAFFKCYGWFITERMVTYKGVRVGLPHKVYLFFEIGLWKV